MKRLVLFILIGITTIFGQDITNKLGASGNYDISDSSNNVLFRVQDDGNTKATGNVTIGAFLNLEVSSISVTDGGDTITPTTSYVKASSVFPTHITLSAATAITDGVTVGQILIIESVHAWNFTIPNNANTKLGGDRVLTQNQMIQLIWNGSDWVMPNSQEVI